MRTSGDGDLRGRNRPAINHLTTKKQGKEEVVLSAHHRGKEAPVKQGERFTTSLLYVLGRRKERTSCWGMAEKAGKEIIRCNSGVKRGRKRFKHSAMPLKGCGLKGGEKRFRPLGTQREVKSLLGRQKLGERKTGTAHVPKLQQRKSTRRIYARGGHGQRGGKNDYQHSLWGVIGGRLFVLLERRRW